MRRCFIFSFSIALCLLLPTQLLAQEGLDVTADADEELGAAGKEGSGTEGEAAAEAQAVGSDPGIQAPTITGLAGLFRLVTADVGTQHTFRVGLHTEMFTSSDFLVEKDDNTRFAGTVALSYTPWKYIEIFLNARSQANSNARPPETGRMDQELILALGDLSLGAKGQYPITDYIALGGNFGLTFLNSVGGVTFDGDSTSFYIGLLTSFDLNPLANFPLRFHFNAGWLLDNSDNLSDDNTFAAFSLTSLVVEKYALGVNRDRMRFKLGLDLPLRRWTKIGVTPIIEFGADVATGDTDKDFDNTRFLCSPASTTKCLTVDDIDGRSTLWLTIGVRVSPLRGFSFDLGADIGLASPGYGYGPPVEPWNLLLGMSYAYDPKPQVRTVTKETIKTVTREVLPKMGKLRGRVLNTTTLTPVDGAIVTFPGKDLTGLFTDPDGSFVTYEMPPGKHPVMVRHADYLPAKLMAEIKVGGVVSMDIKLTPAPPKVGTVAGKISDNKGNALAATITAVGPERKEATCGIAGDFSMEVQPGVYTLDIVYQGFLRKRRTVTVAAGGKEGFEMSLSPKPRWSPVRVSANAITLRKPLLFKGKESMLSPTLTPVLDSLVDALLSTESVRKIEVQGHTDNRGRLADNMQLSQARADAVRDYLVQGGVPADSVLTKGYGPSRPKRPNITARNRAMNNRVEFMILEAQ